MLLYFERPEYQIKTENLIWRSADARSWMRYENFYRDCTTTQQGIAHSWICWIEDMVWL